MFYFPCSFYSLINCNSVFEEIITQTVLLSIYKISSNKKLKKVVFTFPYFDSNLRVSHLYKRLNKHTAIHDHLFF